MSVQIDEIERNYVDLVSIASDKEQFCRAIRRELSDDTPQRSQRRIETARANSWIAHIEQLSEYIEAALGRKAGCRSGASSNECGAETING